MQQLPAQSMSATRRQFRFREREERRNSIETFYSGNYQGLSDRTKIFHASKFKTSGTLRGDRPSILDNFNDPFTMAISNESFWDPTNVAVFRRTAVPVISAAVFGSDFR